MFFGRLEIYKEIPSTTEMMNIITQIMVEVLSILGIVTREIEQGRMSKYLLYKYNNVDRTMCRKVFEEADRKD